MKAYTVYAGSTGEAVIYSVWELLLKGFQRRGLLIGTRLHPEGKGILGKSRNTYLGTSERRRPDSLSWFGPDILQVGLSFAVGLELPEVTIHFRS